MMRNNYQLQEKVNKMIPVYKERFLFGLLNKSGLCEDEIKQRNSGVQHRVQEPVFLCDYHGNTQPVRAYQKKNTNLSVAKAIIQETMEKLFKDNDTIAYIINIDEKRMAVILNVNEESDSKNKENILNLLIGVSNRVIAELQD